MSEQLIHSTIEILGKVYSIRCPEAEVVSLQAAADYLNEKMLEVEASGKAINLERIAIIAALNITNQFLQLDRQKSTLVSNVNQRLTQLQTKLDNVVNKSVSDELIYTTDE